MTRGGQKYFDNFWGLNKAVLGSVSDPQNRCGYKLKFSKEFFHARGHSMCPRGGLTPGVDRRGAIIARRTVGRARGSCPHTSTRTLQQDVPPHGEQTELLAGDSAPSANATTQPFSRIAWPMTALRRLFLCHGSRVGAPITTPQAGHLSFYLHILNIIL